MKKKLWFKLFLALAAVFAAFVILLTVANSTMLLSFFTYRQKTLLTEQLHKMQSLDFTNGEQVREAINEISETYPFEIEVSTENGVVIYTTSGAKGPNETLPMIPDFKERDKFNATRSEEIAGGVFEIGTDFLSKREFLSVSGETEQGLFVQIRMPMEVLKNSADIANEFIAVVAIICFALALVWTFFFARRFTRPIVKMNEITEDMAKLKFDRRVKVKGEDEIARLGKSVNIMSDNLSAALNELSEKNAVLEGEIERKKQLDEMRKAFVANVSHELKTPIAIISGYAEGLKMNVNEEKKEEYLNIITDESKRMNRLVHSILDLSRHESGQVPVTREVFDLRPMCDELLKRMFEGDSVTVQNDISAGTLVFSDAFLTERILKVYLENAKSHVRENGSVRVFAEEEGGKLKINVFNEGENIEAEKLPHIWESFYRGEVSHKREASRFGLGLSIVSSIVKNMNEECGVLNLENGVCFYFTAEIAEKSGTKDIEKE